MKPTFEILPGKANPQKLKEILRQIKEELPIQLEITKELAKLTKGKYDAYISVEFTPDQALYLCKDGTK